MSLFVNNNKKTYLVMNMKKFNEELDDMAQEFKAGGVIITRYDYESLPDPMCAAELHDETMQKIAQDTYEYLLENGWEDKTIDRYLGEHLDDLDDSYDGRDARLVKDDFWKFMEQAAVENGMRYYKDMSDEEYRAITSGERFAESLDDGNTPEFLNVERFRKEIKEVLEEETSGWDETVGDYVQNMKDSAPDDIDEYVDMIVEDAIESFNKLVHKDDTSMSGNFKDIRYDWDGFHREYPHGVSLKEVVEMIDAGEDNEFTKEFKDWAVDWYFEAFGTYNLKYNWSNFMEEVSADYEYQQERDAEEDEN